ENMTAPDWGWMALLCMTGALGHYLLIRCYEVAEASAVQPFAYLQLVFGAAIGVSVFGEIIRWNVAAGAALVVAAGLFTLWRERQAAAGA
ncbi:MAG: EamA family transporter, partial [Pseudomonadota bacterium]